MKLIYSTLLTLIFFSCKKEIVSDLEQPKHLLLDDIYLNCDPFDPAQHDYISFTLNDKTNCISIKRPSANSSSCFIKSGSLGGANIWYNFFLCDYNHYLYQDTELLIYLSKDKFENNIENLTVGEYQYHQEGNPIADNDNLFKMRLLPLSQSYADAGFISFTRFKTDSFGSELAVQDAESYLRITEIGKHQEGSVTWTRFHLEFSCTLQDAVGRKIQIKNGTARITFPLN